MKRRRSGQSLMALMFSVVLTAGLAMPTAAPAKEDGDRGRLRFQGWVEAMPEGLHGTWVIGGRQVTTSSGTEFDQTDGPLRVGGCAKVDVRGGMVHEIDSEPAEDCR